MTLDTNTNQPQKNRLSISLDSRIIILLLLATIAGMLAMWRPWNSSRGSDRTIKVTGEAKVRAVPDEFVFYPSYEFKNPDKTAALKELTAKTEDITNKLKGLGVEANKIKTNSSGFDQPAYHKPDTKEATYYLSFTITLSNRDLTQKVQDYLVSTNPSGQVSPQPSFSDAKRKELESQARDAASKEARSKAEQSARNLGFKVGDVKAIEDGGGFGDVYPLMKEADMTMAPSTRLAVQPGENELNYSVTVTYFVR